MEKRTMANVCRTTAIIIGISFAAFSTNAQLINGGFETAGTNYILQPDSLGVIVTNTFAAGWTPNGPAFVTRDLTTSPSMGVYEESDFGYDFVGLNQTASGVTAHTGTAALRTFGPFVTPPDADASGASQEITNNFAGQVVSNGQIWVVSGYGLNWSLDPLNPQGVGSVSFGILQVAFYDATNGIISTANSNEITTNTPLDTWTSCTVTGQAPPGTAGVAAFAFHIGNNGGLGSVLWDDVILTNIGIAGPPPIIVTNQFQATIQQGLKVCWSSVVNASYQPQFSDDNVTWTNIGSLIPGDGTSNCTFAVTHKFYRVVQSQ
jgi:hypothetical protein